MAYCTKANLVTAIGDRALLQLADLDGDGLVDDAAVTLAIRRADALINTHLSKQYTVPVVTVPDELLSRSIDITVYFLRKGRGTLDQHEIDEHKADLEWLQAVARGDLVLDVDPVPPKHSIRKDGVTEREEDVVDVGRRNLRGFW